MFTIRSSAFEYGDEIPSEYRRDGGLTPPLSWTGAPSDTRELALIFEDAEPGSSGERAVYWLLYRIPAQSHEIPQGRHPRALFDTAPGAMHGQNSAGGVGYLGPLPPADGEWHHYRFRLLALSRAPQELRPGMSLPELMSVIQPWIIESTDLGGRMRRVVSAPKVA